MPISQTVSIPFFLSDRPLSPDRELIDAFANRIIKLNEDGTVIDFEGDYEAFVEQYGH